MGNILKRTTTTTTEEFVQEPEDLDELDSSDEEPDLEGDLGIGDDEEKKAGPARRRRR